MKDPTNASTPLESIMSRNVRQLSESASVADAAMAMRDQQVGGVVVTDDKGRATGFVTDRDIVVRSIADGRSPSETKLRDICTRELHCLSPKQSVGDAIGMMADKAIRRVPVVDKGKAVGIISLGDLAEHVDPNSVLGRVSTAPPNT